MLGLFFSFGSDTECLTESIAAFRGTFPQGKVCVCDDPSKPLTYSALSALDADHYERADWERRGNLNGWDAVAGILDFQCRMHQKFPGIPGAIKIDCDTLVLGTRWFDPSDAIAGFDLGTGAFLAGCARYLRRDAAETLLSDCQTRPAWTQIAVPEDRTITLLALWAFGQECRRNDWRPLAASWQFKSDDNARSYAADVVTFGNRRELGGSCTDCDKRTLAALAMAKFRKRKTNG